tara:strand:- start:147 stop:326 length:180 start_codon:yes stop_codon:yes gene_type:complete
LYTNNHNLKIKKHGFNKSMQVFDLINRVKSDEKKEKRNTILIAAGAVSALLVSGIIISL